MVPENVQRVGRLFFNVQNNSTNQVIPVVAPSNNTTGLVIRTAVLDGAQTSGLTFIYADTEAPAPPSSTAIDLTKRIIYAVSAQQAYTNYQSLPFPLYVDPGLGLWYVQTGPGSIFITYDLV